MKKETLIRLLCILLALCTVFAIGCTKNPPADETPSDNPEEKPGDQPGDKPQNPPEDGPTDIPEEKTGKPTDLRINLLSAPFGVDKNDLRFSWVMNDEDQNEVQKAYRITVAETAAALAAGEFVHDSGWVESSGSAALETLEFMHKNGYRLIGEIVPYFHAWDSMGMNYGSKGLMEILELAGEYNMIFSYHTMPEWQEQMEHMIAQNPKVTFVAAHPGEYENYKRHLECLKKYDNAYLDISGNGLYRYGMLREGIRQAGDEKLLFGTDYPITNPGMYVEAVCFEHISEESREKIFFRNAQRIIE